MLKKDYITWAKSLGVKGYSKMSKLELEYECTKKEAELSALELQRIEKELNDPKIETTIFNEYLASENKIKLFTNIMGKSAFEDGFSFIALTEPQPSNDIPFIVEKKHIRDTISYKEIFNIKSVKFL